MKDEWKDEGNSSFTEVVRLRLFKTYSIIVQVHQDMDTIAAAGIARESKADRFWAGWCTPVILAWETERGGLEFGASWNQGLDM